MTETKNPHDFTFELFDDDYPMTIAALSSSTSKALALSPTSFTFQYKAGTNALPAAQSLRISVIDPTTGTEIAESVSVRIRSDATWLNCVPTTGATVLTSSVSLTSAIKQLAPASYTTVLEVSGSDLTNSPQSSQVNLTIRPKGKP